MDLGKEVAYGEREHIKASVFSNNKIIIETQNIDAETVIELNKIEGVEKILESDSVLTLTIGSNFKLANVLSILERDSVNIKKISYEDVKLEDVFLALTGKNLRD